MGEYAKAKYAYMIPVLEGKIPDDKPESPGIPIYKVHLDNIESFKAKFDKVGWDWHPLYMLQDATDYIMFDD